MPYHSYLFFDLADSLTPQMRSALPGAGEFIECVESHNDIAVQAYATLGFKSGTRFMLHCNAASPDAIQLFVRDLLHTPLGSHLRISYTLFGMTRDSQYKPKHAPAASKPEVPHRYLVVYPFTKTIEWHLLPFETRREVMKAHVDVGRKHSEKISQMLLYSYGIDDHEFVVSYYMDDLDAFQALVMEMRTTESRRHTKNDLPIFTCIHMPLKEALEML